MKVPSIIRRMIPIDLGSPESYFPELKDNLKETLRKSLQDEFAKIAKNGFKIEPETPEQDQDQNQEVQPDPAAIKADIKKFNAEWEKNFESAVTIEYIRNVRGYEKGKVVHRNQVKIIIADDFDKACSKYGVYLSTTLQASGVSFMSKQGFNVKEYQPVVSVSLLKVA